MKYFTRLTALLGVALFSACTIGAEAELADRLGNAANSAEHIVQAALDGLLARDEGQLVNALITKDEWESLLWPEMPDRDHTPFDFVWSMSSSNSNKNLGKALKQYGGLPFEVVRVEYTKESERYPSFTLHKGAQVVVRRLDTGERGIMPIFDVLVDYRGQWKLMDYDEP